MENFTVLNVYNPTKTDLGHKLDVQRRLSERVDFLIAQGVHVIVVGDLKADIRIDIVDRRKFRGKGKIWLYDWLLTGNLVDVYHQLHPGSIETSYFGQTAWNFAKAARVDYVLSSLKMEFESVKRPDKQQTMDLKERLKSRLVELLSEPAVNPTFKLIDLEGLSYAGEEGRTFTCLYADNILSQEECNLFIEWSEALDYEQARVHGQKGDPGSIFLDYRKSQRAITDDYEISKLLLARIKHLLPHELGKYKLLAMNERLRFLKYEKGDFFKRHYDGSYRQDNATKTKITVQFYFNQPVGGATSLLGPERTEKVAALPGRALIFEHAILHQGDEVEDLKYALRTDILYQKVDPMES